MNIINAIKTACVGIALVTQGNATRQTNPQLQTPIFETTKKIIDGALEFTSFTDMGTCLFPDAKHCKTVRTDVSGKVLACASQDKREEEELKECYVKKAHAHYADLKGKQSKIPMGLSLKI